jgi:CYTH domain-containing protein
MPIENERKFVLDDDGKLEARLAEAPDVTRTVVDQAYLDAPGLRIRSMETGAKRIHIFTYKREIDGKVVEIETEIAASDFDRLWSQRRESLRKTRYSWPDGHFHWDVDFFKMDDGRTYFAMAEVEMPENDVTPPPLSNRLASHFLANAPHRDPRFTSKRLSDPVFAGKLLTDIRQKGKVE